MKTCNQCQGTFDVSEFYKNSARCKTCHKAYTKQHYQDNKQQYLDKARRYDEKYLIEFRELTLGHFAKNPCIDCGNTDFRVLDFDHVRGIKEFNISDAARQKIAIPRVIEEIKKCDVRCANCHRIVTGERAGWAHHLSL